MEEKLKELMQELGNAINESLSDSDRIAAAIGEIKRAGYDVFLVLEATIGFNKRDESGEYEPEEDAEAAEFEGAEDPAYTDAVRVVLEMGKASTSTLQRRLRLGYGRAARILDMMQREGIIGPPDGSKPREVLKRPDWLEEVENQLR